MVLVSRAIEGEVNLYDGWRLQASSQRHHVLTRSCCRCARPGTSIGRFSIDRQPTSVSAQGPGTGYLLERLRSAPAAGTAS